MLDELVVSNLGLIDTASLSPGEGLTVITGETGAGKTAMLGALRLLMGEQAPKGLIGPHGESLDVSARFTGPAEHTARRVVTRSTSKAYLDGGITTAGGLKEAIGSKIAIVGQHDQHRITSSDGVRQLVDGALTTPERRTVETYLKAWTLYEEVRGEADELGSDHRGLTRELETLRFQTQEIADAGFEVGDDHDLAERANRLRNAGELAETIAHALRSLSDEGAAGQLTEATRALTNAASLDGSLSGIASQLSDVSTVVSDITAEVTRYSSDLDTNPANLEETEQRVALLSSLKRKYGDSVETILAFAKNATEREAELTELLTSAETISQRLTETELAVSSAGQRLRKARLKAGQRVADGAIEHLKELGFSTPVVAIDVSEAEPTLHGCDKVTVLFASDDTLSVGPVSSIASGGELSRLVLALTLSSGAADADIVAFDEIDSGVGGETALAMGRKLASLANSRQVICVTHLPQVAAYADKHYVVTRSANTAVITEATGDDRVEELSRMLAGLASSQKGRQHAKELLALARTTLK